MTQTSPSTAPELDARELARYRRHLSLPEVGVDGQRRLKGAKVLIVGAGGLGSPAALYLAAAGVGTIGLVDFDRVEETNLQRQILYGTTDVGVLKVEAARARLLSHRSVAAKVLVGCCKRHHTRVVDIGAARRSAGHSHPSSC